MKKNLWKVLLALLCAAALLTGCTRQAAPTQSGTAPATTHSGTAAESPQQENGEAPCLRRRSRAATIGKTPTAA